MTTRTTKLSALAFLGLSLVAYGQYDGKVGINEPQPKATLEITPNTANKSTTASTVEGILIPRVSRLRASNMGTAVTESTLLYIDSVADGAASGTTVNVDATGFYFFKEGAWVKMGAGASSTAGALFGNIKVLANITEDEWAADDFAIVLTNGLTNAALPKAALNKGRIISIRNASAGLITYTANAPKNNSTISLNRGQLIQSDGINWYVIGGF
ncbi:hypothetical protein [Riemerella anatipestifer]|uniref:hypothetical protein n=1 Tax=Riemerella anatipestifer TaxID=34085 RepID=UPI0012B3067C|nr:hypothetical protein [Riemerella anatipestifer]MCO7354580.1 hypothetical protein [Riemerella anatipestifer]MSN86265.1 hypothetical protein [Riemerella anatipestifer]QYQ95951.1 hypothetical protein J6342_06205 [Riemerella anatipestifer]WFS31979.1 hypothetical protein D1Y77_005505 [Riemerella anatipestifer]